MCVCVCVCVNIYINYNSNDWHIVLFSVLANKAGKLYNKIGYLHNKSQTLSLSLFFIVMLCNILIGNV